jgi:sarcosine dehydrogenase
MYPSYKLQLDCLIVSQVKNDFAFSLFDLDWDVFSVHIQGACNRVPVIEETGIKSTVCGPESFTADHKPLMGEVPELRGFYLGCGFNSSGIMLAGGCGRELARWIVNGHPELDMFGYDIRYLSHFIDLIGADLIATSQTLLFPW